MNKVGRGVLLWCGLILGLFLAWRAVTMEASRSSDPLVPTTAPAAAQATGERPSGPRSADLPPPVEEIPYSQLKSEIAKGAYSEAKVRGQGVFAKRQDGTRIHSVAPDSAEAADLLSDSGAKTTVIPAPTDEDSGFTPILFALLPPILMVLVMVWMMKSIQGGANRLGSVGRSRARLLPETKDKVTFADVAGVEEAKQELEEIVDYLKDPLRFQRLGGRIPKGVLLSGPPGTGKTLLARAVAGEAGVPFFSISGSDFVEMFVGVGAARVRDMFAEAKKHAPCIVFVDEIDAVGRHRGVGMGGGNDEREQTLNQLLVEMDGFEASIGIILVAATNRPDILDPALIRPGRFDRQVVVPNPDVAGRERILAVHLRKVPTAPDVDPRALARGTPGFSGADLSNLVNEAALMAARRSAKTVSMKEFEAAKDKVMMGAERRSMVMGEDERRLTAWHEAGHALLALVVDGNDPLHKVSIVPRGRALGVTVSLPERDRYGMRKSEILARMVMMHGGRAAEIVAFGEDSVTTGASDDIRRATDLARRMVEEWGMSDALGPMRWSDDEENPRRRPARVSEDSSRLIDAEIRRICDERSALALSLLKEREAELKAVAEALLEHETLSADQVRAVLRGEILTADAPAGAAGDDPAPKSARPSARKEDGPKDGDPAPVGPVAVPSPGPA